MAHPILVTGGTGGLGREVVALLRAKRQTTRIVSRSVQPAAPGLEYVSADLGQEDSVPDLTAAVADVETVIHLAGSATGDLAKTEHLLQAIKATGRRPHIVLISVVGAGRTPVVSGVDRALFGYVAAKRSCEQLVAGADLPWSVLRATQFHTFIATTAIALAKLPIVMVPSKTRVQPVEGQEVAQRLVELAGSEPTMRIEEFGGPQAYAMDSLIRDYLHTVGKPRPMVRVRLPGRAAAAFRAGANLTPGHAQGRRTWEEFLTDVAPEAAAADR